MGCDDGRICAPRRTTYATVTDQARVAAAVLATTITHGRLASPFTAREVYRTEWAGLTDPRIVQGAPEGLDEIGTLRAEAMRARVGASATATHSTPSSPT